MQKFLSLTKEFILDILFPKFCLSCGKEGSYLCEDCFSIIDILKRQYCPFCYPPKAVADAKTCIYCRKRKRLNGLYCATSYNNFIAKKLINQFKYGPYIKELSKPLSSLIIAYFLNLETLFDAKFKNFILIPIPLHKNKLKQRGFNQAEEIAKELSKYLEIPIISNFLIKIKQTPAQVELDKKQRKNNIKGVFLCPKLELINPVRGYQDKKKTQSPQTSNGVKNKKILLVDDIFTTGSTMEECAKILKEAGAKEVWGVVVARG